jgi:hypothetical protein
VFATIRVRDGLLLRPFAASTICCLLLIFVLLFRHGHAVYHVQEVTRRRGQRVGSQQRPQPSQPDARRRASKWGGRDCTASGPGPGMRARDLNSQGLRRGGGGGGR